MCVTSPAMGISVNVFGEHADLTGQQNTPRKEPSPSRSTQLRIACATVPGFTRVSADDTPRVFAAVPRHNNCTMGQALTTRNTVFLEVVVTLELPPAKSSSAVNEAPEL